MFLLFSKQEEVSALQKPLSSFEQTVLKEFFENLFKETSAGYAIFGEKPVYWNHVPDLQSAVPGSKKHFQNLRAITALKVIQQLVVASKEESDFLMVFPDTSNPVSGNREFMIINRKAFLDVVKESLPLFKKKFGINITPELLLNQLIQHKKSFSSLFGKDSDLQGILLGYGINNAISYSRGSKLMEVLSSTSPKNPPYKLANYPKTEFEMKQCFEEHPETKNSWIDIKKETADFTFYQPKNSEDKLKIPFSFHAKSAESKTLLKMYEVSQERLHSLEKSERFLDEILKKLNLKKKTTDLSSFFNTEFTEKEKERLNKIIAKFIYSYFPEETLPSFIEGMKKANQNDSGQLNIPESTAFLDILREQTATISARYQNSLISTKALKSLSKESSTTTLIPNKLIFKVLKQGHSEAELTRTTKSLVADFVITDISGETLAGSFTLENPSELTLKNLISGLAHGMIGMKKGEVREIYIHPDLAYGTQSRFGNGKLLKVKVKLHKLGKITGYNCLPALKPVDVCNHVGDIASCEEFRSLQEQYSFICGHNTWMHYKKFHPSVSLNSLIKRLKDLHNIPSSLTSEERKLLLKIEWSIYSNKYSNPQTAKAA